MVDRPKSTDLGLIYMFSNIGVTAAVFFLPLLLKDRGLSDLEIGYLALPYSLALFFANSIFGRLTDSHGRKPFLIMGLLSSSVTTFLYILPADFYWVGLVRLLNGISLGIFPAAIYAIASDRETPMGVLSSWRALGWAIGAILNGLMAEVFQLEVAFLLGSFLFFIGFLYALWKDTGGRVDSLKQNELTADRPDPEYGVVMRQNWQIYLAVILRHSSGSSIWVYWTLFLQQNLELNNLQIGIVLAINTVVQTVVMRFFGDRGDPRRMLLLGTFLSALSFISFPFTSNFIEISLTQVLLGISFSFFLVGGLRVAEIRGSQLGMVGTATGLFEASFSISQVIGPVLAIIVFSQFQTYTSLMYVASIITFIATVFYWFISYNKSLNIADTTSLDLK